jgi:hypothetical protein
MRRQETTKFFTAAGGLLAALWLAKLPYSAINYIHGLRTLVSL